MNESPASHQLATALGVSAHRMQVMKASFFGESEPFVPSPQPKEKSSMVKSLLSGSFDERSHRGSLPLGPMLSPKVAKHTDLVGQNTQSSSVLFRSPKIGTVLSIIVFISIQLNICKYLLKLNWSFKIRLDQSLVSIQIKVVKYRFKWGSVLKLYYFASIKQSY